MTTPTHVRRARESQASMSPERWRRVDAIIKVALASDPEIRDTVVAEACGDDEALRGEVQSLLDAYAEDGDDFLEQPAAPLDAVSDRARLERALAGRYRIEAEVGRGGMATVYLARDLKHDRAVAIKVLRDAVAAAIGAERFLAEIRVTASLQHAHILPLFDSGSADGLLWYAMPYVEGETLRERLQRERRLPVGEATRLAREVAEALEHAHARGVVHRDVKPENVLLRDGHALVADFGIALALEHAGGDRLTQTGLTLGTPQYMAPEQAAGERHIDARADVYALGAVLHEMVAGESPFAAPSRQAVVQRLMHERPVALAERHPGLPDFLSDAVFKALAKRPDDRFPSAAAFAAALDRATAPPPAAPAYHESTDRAHAPHEARGRLVTARAAMMAALLMLVVGAAGGAILARSSLVDRWLGSAEPWQAPAVEASRAIADAIVGETGVEVMDRGGRSMMRFNVNRPWTPRFSPDGRQVVYGAFGEGRNTSDVWVSSLASGETRRLTDGDDDANDPQWSPDGTRIAYSANASGGKDLRVLSLDSEMPTGGQPLAARSGTQFASDWMRRDHVLLVTDQRGSTGLDVMLQPEDGTPARPFVVTRANESAARGSPDGRWVSYTSDASGRNEVWIASFDRPTDRVQVSRTGGAHAVWRADGRELYFWRDGQLIALELTASPGDKVPVRGKETVLFRAEYPVDQNLMYDVSPDGERIVIVRNR